MPYATYTRQMLADFTGRPVASFPDPYVTNSVIPQATLLFKIGTCLASPDALTTDQKQLVDFAILSMADKIHLNAPYQPALSSPFQHESIGSYSYSFQKLTSKVQKGEETGVMWFDLAIDQLSVCDEINGSFAQGGIEIYEHDGIIVGGRLGGQGENVRYLSPQDLNQMRTFGYDFGLGTVPWGMPPLTIHEVDDDEWIEDPNNPGVWILKEN